MKIQIIVKPGKSVSSIIEGNPLVVQVKERAVRGKATLAALKLLSKHFGRKVRLVSGASSRQKMIEVSD